MQLSVGAPPHDLHTLNDNIFSGYCFGAPFVCHLAAEGAIVAGTVSRGVILFPRSPRVLASQAPSPTLPPSKRATSKR